MIRHAAVTARYTADAHDELPYRWCPPTNADAKAPQPLLVFLHGLGERGAENHFQLSYDFFRNPHSLFGTTTLAAQNAYVVAPQCPDEDTWVDVRSWKDPAVLKPRPTRALQRVESLIDAFAKSHAVDRRRIYLTGLSMGAFGSLELAIRRKNHYAAVLSVCGAADGEHVAALAQTPLFLIHGASDKAVPAERSRAIFLGLKALGVAPRYVEYPDGGHDVWDRGYAEQDVIHWLFSQRLPAP